MTLIVRPGFQFDTDASTYIEAVEVADTQALETATRYAINNFVIGCKQDGIWSAIKASCILAGARTLAGALVPLMGTAPTNVGPFVSGDYNRKTGLVGNGSTKWLNSNRANNADPQNSSSLAIYATTLTSAISFYMGAGNATPSSTSIGWDGNIFAYSRANTVARPASLSGSHTVGLIGIDRSSSSDFRIRSNKITSTATVSSVGTSTDSLLVFNTAATSGLVSNARLAFYSIGESLDLALLDARVTALITAFGVAIP
jgi:hypothetical protein